MPDEDPVDPASAAAAEIAALRAELARVRSRADGLALRLGVVQRIGRIGTWERDIASGQARWDEVTFQIWGLAPDRPGLTIEELASSIEPAERESTIAYYQDSLQRVGNYGRRFSLRTPAGSQRRVFAQWEVIGDAEGHPIRMVGVLMDETDPLAPETARSPLLMQLTQAVEMGNILIWRHDLDSQRLHWNTAGWRTLGLEPRPEGLTLDEVRAMIHPDDLPRVVASAQRALESTEPVDLEARYRHADGSWRIQLLRRMVLRDESGRPTAFLGIALDVTERRTQERRSAQMSRRFEAVLHTAGIGQWVNDLARGQIEWNAETRRIHGLPDGAPPPGTREWLERFVHPEDRATVGEAIARLPTSGERGLDVALRIVRADGSVRHLASHTRMESSEDGEVIFGLLFDITERLEAQVALRSAETRIALALRGVGIGAWEVDLETRELRWDPQMWRLRGVEPEPGAPDIARIHDFVHPDDRDAAYGVHARYEGGHDAIEHEFRVVWPDGSVRWLASRSREVTDSDGRRRRIGVNWDVTDTRTADRTRQDAELARRESQAKSRFLARMSHELRTPLNAVLGFTQLMLAEEQAVDAAAALRRVRLGHVATAGTHLLELIDDVLTLSGAEGGELRFVPQTVALAPLAAEAVSMLAAPAAERELQVETALGALAVQADPTRLRQVLLNLIGNALKYNRPGGRVVVSARPVEGPGALCVRIEIADTGPGLRPEQLAHLFEPFNRLGAEGGAVPGHGIGLAIVKALVQRMGGRVWAESWPGEGSRFFVELPQAETTAPADAAMPTSAPAEAGPGGPERPTAPGTRRRRLVYIEDNPINAMIVRELVAGRGDLELAEAADGRSGLALVQAAPPAAVLLDMQLPDIDGLEVLRRLKADPSTASVPVVVVSANAMPEDIRRTLAAGASAYWTKPLDFARFREGLDALLAGDAA